MTANPELTPQQRLDAMYAEAAKELPRRTSIGLLIAVAEGLLSRLEAAEARVKAMETMAEQDAGYLVGHFKSIQKLIEGTHYADAHSYLGDLMQLAESAMAREEARKKGAEHGE